MPPVVKKYMSDTYCFSHHTLITKIDKDEKGHFVCLSETIFHPQGGAQPDDMGTINGKKVIRLSFVGEEIYHYLEDITGLQVNDTVELLIDKDTRLHHAALHSTGHIMAAILRNQFSLKNQTGANHFPKQASVKFAIEATSNIPTADAFTHAVQEVITEKRQLKIVFIEGERCLAIEHLDEGLRCGGTHLTHAGEIDQFTMRNVKVDKKKNEVSFGYDCTHRALSSLFHVQRNSDEERMETSTRAVAS